MGPESGLVFRCAFSVYPGSFKGTGRLISSFSFMAILWFFPTFIWSSGFMEPLLPMWQPFFWKFRIRSFVSPNWMHFLLPLVYAVNWIIFLHVFLSGALTFAWARFRGLSTQAAFIAGTVWMWCGAFYLHLSAGHIPNLCAMTWIPLVFLGLEGILEKGTAVWACLLTLALTMQILAGHPQYVFFTLGVGGLFFCLRIFQSGQKGLKTILALGSLLFAGGLAAAQLFTGYEAEGEGLRQLSLDYKMASSFSLPFENILTLVFPEFFGKLEPGSYWGRWYPWEVSLFIGITAFVLAIIGWSRVRSIRRRADLILLFLVFLFALGPGTPLYPLLYQWFPRVNEMRGWAKLDVFFALLIAMSAGMGFDFLLKELTPRRNWIRTFTIIASSLLLLGLGLFLLIQYFPKTWGASFAQIAWIQKTMDGLDPSVRETFTKDSGFHLVASLVIGSVFFGVLAFLFSLKNYWRNWGVLILCVAELFIFARMNRPTFPISTWENKVSVLKGFCTSHPGDDRVYGTSSDSLIAGSRDIWEYEPMVLRRYGQFVASTQGLEDNRLYSVMPVFSRFSPLFGLVRLRYLLEESPTGLRFLEMPFPRLPRFKLFEHWDVFLNGETARKALIQPRFDFFHKVILEKAPRFNPGKGKGAGKLDWNEIDSEHIEIRAELSKPSVLLVTDNYSDGWHARPLDGSGQNAYEVLPGDYFLQAIPLGAGSHHFQLEYQPGAFSLGIKVTGVSIFLYLAVIYWLWRKRDHPQVRIS